MTFDEMLADFMDHWPGMKVGKEEVKRQLGKALHKTTFENIRDAEDRLAAWMQATGTEKQFVKHPAKWLHQGCYDDELEMPEERHNIGIPDYKRSAELLEEARLRVKARAANGR